MLLLFSQDFKNEFKKIRDKVTRLRILKQLKKIEECPETGKPLMHNLKNYRCLRISPFRIIYRVEGDNIIVNFFEHRESVYDQK